MRLLDLLNEVKDRFHVVNETLSPNTFFYITLDGYFYQDLCNGGVVRSLLPLTQCDHPDWELRYPTLPPTTIPVDIGSFRAESDMGQLYSRLITEKDLSKVSKTVSGKGTIMDFLKELESGIAITHPLLDNEPVKMDSKGQLHRYLTVDGQWAGTTELKMNYFLLKSDQWALWGKQNVK